MYAFIGVLDYLSKYSFSTSMFSTAFYLFWSYSYGSFWYAQTVKLKFSRLQVVLSFTNEQKSLKTKLNEHNGYNIFDIFLNINIFIKYFNLQERNDNILSENGRRQKTINIGLSKVYFVFNRDSFKVVKGYMSGKKNITENGLYQLNTISLDSM